MTEAQKPDGIGRTDFFQVSENRQQENSQCISATEQTGKAF